jgi:hypothetical protein
MRSLTSRQTSHLHRAPGGRCVVLAMMLFLLSAAGAPQALEAQLPTIGRGNAPPDSIAFQHSLHQKLACAECHGASARKGSNKVTAPYSCRSCHHKPDQAVTCTTCHASEIKFTRQVPVTFKVVARRTPAVTRNLPFRHEQHGKLDCAKCHGTDTDRAVQVNCTSCHADHHGAARNCSTCHPGVSAGHDRTVHDGCTHCHVNAPLPSISASRTLCLTCHERQRDHNPGGSCAGCHAVASPSAAQGERRP